MSVNSYFYVLENETFTKIIEVYEQMDRHNDNHSDRQTDVKTFE